MDHVKKESCPKILLFGTFHQLYHLLAFPLFSVTLEILSHFFLVFVGNMDVLYYI